MIECRFRVKPGMTWQGDRGGIGRGRGEEDLEGDERRGRGKEGKKGRRKKEEGRREEGKEGKKGKE